VKVDGKDDLHGIYWAVSRKSTYEGVPCRYCWVNVKLSAWTGKIWDVYRIPVAVPVEVKQRISKGLAAQRAQEWLDSRVYFTGKAATVDEKALNRIEEVIARPNSFFLGEGEAGYPTDMNDVFRCWEVGFTFIEDGHRFNPCLWVRIDTGEVIGAWRVDE